MFRQHPLQHDLCRLMLVFLASPVLALVQVELFQEATKVPRHLAGSHRVRV